MIDKIFFHLVARWFLLWGLKNSEGKIYEVALEQRRFCVEMDLGQSVEPIGPRFAVRSWERTYGAKP